jgi:indoleamine 2,3-dioxygenase
MTRRLRSLLAGLPPLGTTGLESEAMLDRAMLLLSVLGNAYIWGEKDPAQVLPPGVAIPWWQVAAAVGRPPILSHASMVLQNWRRLNADEPVSLNNLATLQLFLGGLDESWFYLVTVAIEAEGGAAIAAMAAALEAAETHNLDEVTHNLELMAKALECMVETLRRMPEQCDPYVFFHRIRPFLASWPETGVVYEGVDERPYRFAGGSAAQSSLLQALDAGLGIRHNSPFLREMRDYMPPPHHRFIEALTSGPSLRDYVLENKGSYPGLVAWYNTCIHLLDSFRQTHLEYSVRYISHQAAHDQQKSVQGTGGTDFVPLLSQIRKETRNAALMGASHLAR